MHSQLRKKMTTLLNNAFKLKGCNRKKGKICSIRYDAVEISKWGNIVKNARRIRPANKLYVMTLEAISLQDHEDWSILFFCIIALLKT